MPLHDQQESAKQKAQRAGAGVKTTLNYKGPSMYPTLKAGDLMTVISYGHNRIRVGDVVVFPSPEREHNIVHRIISVDSSGIRTIGDNNDNVDSWVLSTDDIVGRVVSAQRKSKDITVHGGTRGRLLFLELRIIKKTKLTVFRIFRPAYHLLARSGFPRRLLSPLIKTQLIYFKRPNGAEIHLLMGQRIIARRLPGKAEWQIRPPFRLLVDEDSLPGENVPHSAIPESNSSTDM